MYVLLRIIHCFFPLIALALLIIGLKRKAIYYVISSLWLSLIALILHYQASGGEILGSYFNYANASSYILNLVILSFSLISIIAHLTTDKAPFFRYMSSFMQALIVICSLLVIVNVGMNAYFIEHRMQGTPVMQVALVQKPEYCQYKYIFYKVAKDGSVDYLCPNHFGLLPSIGHLAVSPDFIASQSPMSGKKQMQVLQERKS